MRFTKPLAFLNVPLNVYEGKVGVDCLIYQWFFWSVRFSNYHFYTRSMCYRFEGDFLRSEGVLFVCVRLVLVVLLFFGAFSPADLLDLAVARAVAFFVGVLMML